MAPLDLGQYCQVMGLATKPDASVEGRAFDQTRAFLGARKILSIALVLGVRTEETSAIEMNKVAWIVCNPSLRLP